MAKINKETVFSPQGIFFIYTIASGLIIMVFRFIFPGGEIPLEHFSASWRLIRGFLDFLRLFPALALSSFVIPYGFKVYDQTKIAPFSPQFLQHLKSPIITVIIAAAIYGFLSFLVIPMAQNYEANILFQSRLFKLAKEKAYENASEEEWDEAEQFIAICERIWPHSPDIEKLKIETEINIQEDLLTKDFLPEGNQTDIIGRLGINPVDAIEAFELAEAALAEERLFDAHWLATLGGRLAKDGSPEKATAARLAGRAWDKINSLAPTNRESKAYSIFKLKKEAHEALTGNEWIRAYYIFMELVKLEPNDPDLPKYLALSANGVREVAFFIDEIELNLGRILTGAVFSLPHNNGRLVMRIDSLSTAADSAYGIGTEIIAFDNAGRPAWNIKTPFCKIMPLSAGSEYGITVLLRALDSEDKTSLWEPTITGMGDKAPNSTELTLKLTWENFLLLSNVRRGLTGLSPSDLKRAAENLANCGYLPQVFEAELLRRFTEPAFLLPLGFFILIIGWRYRALKRPRYMNILMLGILPIVMNGGVHAGRGWLNNLGIMAVVTLGFPVAVISFIIGMVVLLIIILIILAAQHS